MYNKHKSGCNFVNNALKDIKFSAVAQKWLYFYNVQTKKYQPFTMVPCGIFDTRISANFLLKIWLHMLCNQSRHTPSHDLKVLCAKQIFIDILNILYKQIHPVVYFLPVTIVQKQATYWENSCSFGLRYVSWYKYLIVSLVFSHLGFWSGNLFLIAPFPDLCLLVPFLLSKTTTKVLIKSFEPQISQTCE